jgi:hypothetical protein
MTLRRGAGDVNRIMRAPIRSEADAFRVTLGGALLVVVSVVVGWSTVPLAGVAVFVLGGALAAIAYLHVARSDRRPILRDAARAPHPHGAVPGERHVLVVANEALSGTELRERILRHGEHVELDVLAPVLTSHLHYGVSDIDRELEGARARLERSLAWADTLNIVVRGEVGDPSPTTALEDELRDFGADEVIVVTHPRGCETWQERGELERLQRELDVPVTRVAVSDSSMSEPGIRERLVGCWRLVGFSVTAAEGGETDRPLGDNPLGTILYTPDGYMSAQLVRPGPYEGDQEPDAYYIAYSGPYDVDEQARTVAHQVQVSVIPSWLGTTQIRRVQFREPGTLVLSASEPRPSDGVMVTTTISWSRQPPR